METFPMQYFQIGIEHPESAQTVQFGKGWRFASDAEGPDQIVYNLRWQALFWYVTKNMDGTETILTEESPERNVWTLIQFYRDHNISKKFFFENPIEGVQIVRFLQPLQVPEQTWGRGGLVEGITTKLILEP